MRMKKQKRYTAVLLYPDYLAESFGTDVFVAWVKASDKYEAVYKAQKQAVKAQSDVNSDLDLRDFALVIMYRGWLKAVADSLIN